MNHFNYSLLLPIDKAGEPDKRFTASLERIRNQLPDQTIDELLKFHTRALELQKGYSKQGLLFALAVFKEAAYLDQYHRFDDDNPYGYKAKVLRKQAQQTLERLGFSKNNAHKLVATADWYTRNLRGEDERKWLDSLAPSHLYELSRMNSDGFQFVKDEVSYPDFKFSAGQQEITIRRLEQIRRRFPKMEVDSKRSIEGTKQTQRQQPSETINLIAYNELESAEDNSESLQLSAQEVIKQFLGSVEPNSLDKLLNEYTPHAQDQMLALLAEAASRLSDYVASKQSINV